MSEAETSRLVELLARRAAETPTRMAVIDVRGSAGWTFRELMATSAERRRYLPASPGAVALAVDNTAFCPWFLALRAAGRPVILMDAQPAADLKRQTCRALGVDVLIHGRGPNVEVEALAGVEVRPAPPGTDVVKLTSGSTGAPAGLCFAEDELLIGFRQIAEGMEIDGDDRILLAIPLTHSYGFDNGLLSLAVAGTPLILESRIFPRDLHRAVRAGEATFLPLVPPLVGALAAVPWTDLPSLRRVICAGGVLAPEAGAAFFAASGLHVHNFYGSSETGGICFERAPEAAEAAGTVGRPLPGVRLDLDGDGRVTVHSAANRRALWGDGKALAAADRAVRTGDLGVLEAGRLRLVGRATRRLNIGGRKVAAEGIEAALRRLDGVRDAAVVGVPDSMRGDRVVAFLVTDGRDIDLSSLPAGQRPRAWRRLDALPLSPRGKVDRRALEQMAQAASGSASGRASEVAEASVGRR